MHSCECDAAGIRAAKAKDPGFAMTCRDEPMTRTLGAPPKRAARRMHRAAVVAALCLACAPGAEAPDDAPPARDTAGVVVPIDSAIAPAIAGQNGWNYVQRATADLDGDGATEDVVLTARVELYRGRPAWDDGQPWQVYVESAEGARAYLYAQRLQLGTLTMRVTTADSAGDASIVLLEQVPDRMTVYEGRYDHQDGARLFLRFQRPLDPRGQVASPLLP